MRSKHFLSLTLALFLVSGFSPSASAQEGDLRDESPSIPVEEIIESFAAKESEFRLARANYVYRRDIHVEDLNVYNDRVEGEFRLVSDIGFEPDGVRRTEEIVYAPPNTLRNFSLTPQDMEAMDNIQPFVLASEDLDLYDVTYVGKQQIDEIDNYVFDVSPRRIEDGNLYFEGRIWVDDLDLQIVKTYGQSVPEDERNVYPHFETYRQQVDGYWFPTYIRALETLSMNASQFRVRQVIRYDNYRQFEADVTFTVGDEVEVELEAAPDTDPQP